ncbi:hypothetical protein, partial [Guyparkeria sp.]|uniref:hypothetical protein n=1 Tax=Guyparkeria sp. TaxID=2035736 RepID=UPI003970B14D
LMEVEGLKILVDCGLFQGGREIDEENEREFGFDPRSISRPPWNSPQSTRILSPSTSIRWQEPVTPRLAP